MRDPVLQLTDITKRFGSVTALDKVTLEVFPGEIRGLIGENGSGKSTISSIAAGMQKANEGNMLFNGKPWHPENMIDALEHGIGMVVQESGTIGGISVAENMFLGETRSFPGRAGTIDRKKMNLAAEKALSAIGVGHIPPDALMSALDFQTRKLVEIAKVDMKKPDVLIIDETSTALSQDGREIMYRLIRKYRDENRAVLFISHDLDEIMEVCDALTVLRDGSLVRTFTKEEFRAEEIRTSMIGRELKGDYYRTDQVPSRQDETALEAEDLCLEGALHHVSLKLHKGEIVGVGGLSSCGMHTLGKVLFGAMTPERGRVRTGNGKQISSPASAIKERIGYVSKDRDTESLCLTAGIRDNISIAGMDRYALGGFLITRGREKRYVDEQIRSLSIKCSGRDQLTGQLSGGNKQKVVFGKWIGCGSEILILDCPTRGVDIGVKQAMYQLMVRLKKEGKAILMISEEMSELIGMSDRVLVMKNGQVTQEIGRGPLLTDENIIQYMI